MFANGVYGCLEEIARVYAGDFDWILKRQEDALAGSLLGGKSEQILAVVGDRSLGDLVGFAAGKDLCERALPEPFLPMMA
jgi:hypothetical protein